MAYGINNWPKARNTKKVNAIDGYNTDIIEAIHQAFFRAVAETRPMAQQFKGETRKATAFNVWQFIKKTIKYKKDPDSYQMIRLPGRLLQDGEGDCKSVSIMAAAILKNLGFPVMFRYASYTSSSTPTHIYTVTFEKDNTPIIVDCVWPKFNDEAKYKSKRDVLMKIIQ